MVAEAQVIQGNKRVSSRGLFESRFFLDFFRCLGPRGPSQTAGNDLEKAKFPQQKKSRKIMNYDHNRDFNMQRRGMKKYVAKRIAKDYALRSIKMMMEQTLLLRLSI